MFTNSPSFSFLSSRAGDRGATGEENQQNGNIRHQTSLQTQRKPHSQFTKRLKENQQHKQRLMRQRLIQIHHAQASQKEDVCPSPKALKTLQDISSAKKWQQAKMKNDPSFTISPTNSSAPLKTDKRERHCSKPFVKVHKTDVPAQPADTRGDLFPNKPEEADRQCPRHKKPHPLETCKLFREKPLEERKV
ncbi:hypothetical protein D4764_01G0009800 [Takifugu flavidus]|uniref:Uncharacterized protein n=1 Tax=Takifugu flavidus TaxID=433684 RepID=A0A5C6PNY1_9TELE|nr:hypothetical protein D4764_01G0009800 [Takifugu flavidus]